MVYRWSRNFFSIISPESQIYFISRYADFIRPLFFATGHVESLICDNRLTESKYFDGKRRIVIKIGGNPGETLISWQISW